MTVINQGAILKIEVPLGEYMQFSPYYHKDLNKIVFLGLEYSYINEKTEWSVYLKLDKEDTGHLVVKDYHLTKAINRALNKDILKDFIKE